MAYRMYTPTASKQCAIPITCIHHQKSKSRLSKYRLPLLHTTHHNHIHLTPHASSSAFNNPDNTPRPIVTPDGIIDADGSILQRPPLDPEEKRKLWKAAIKAPMYSVGLAPILVSAAAAYVNTGAFAPFRTLGLCLGAIAIIAWLNLSNDVFDSMTGVDKTKPESVVNLTGNRILVFVMAHVALALGAGLLFYLVSSVPNFFVTKALYAAICCGYLYQGPPFRWSYLGLGEPLCFIAFGPLATNAFYLAQIPAIEAASIATAAAQSSNAWLGTFSALPSSMMALSTLIGVTTTVILFCSHFHQIKGDTKAGKMSPLVRLGSAAKGAGILKFVVGATYAVTLVLSLFGVLPFAVWTSAMVAYGYAGEMVKFAEQHADDDEALRPLKMLATKWHIGFSSMLILGLIVQKLMVI